jgi:hypothetical protein
MNMFPLKIRFAIMLMLSPAVSSGRENCVQNPPFGQVVYAEGFEEGLGGTELFSVGECGIKSGSTNQRSDKNARSGHYSIEQHYVVAQAGVNGCAPHQDVNLNVQYVGEDGKAKRGFTTVAMKADFLFATPARGASKSIQRKLMWAKSGNNGTGQSKWEFILTTDGTSGRNGKLNLRAAYQDKLDGGHSYSLYRDDADDDFRPVGKSSLQGSIFELDFDKWYNIEVVLSRRTSKDQSSVYIYIDSSLVFKKSKNWQRTTTSPNARASFPVADDPGNFTWFWFGQQADRVARGDSADKKIIDEYRFVDNIMICSGGRCPVNEAR